MADASDIRHGGGGQIARVAAFVGAVAGFASAA